MADEAVSLGGQTAAESYLKTDLILQAAKDTGAEAIIPGYGFLSENAEFAEACAANGIAFVGPTPQQLREFGLKHEARAIAEKAGVPLAPGTDLLASLDGRRVLALCDMGELGEWAEQSHREVGEHAREAGLDALYATGRLSALAVDAFGEQGCLFDSREALVAALAPTLDANTRVLVKGSRSAGMDTVVAGLLAPADGLNNDNGAS